VGSRYLSSRCIPHNDDDSCNSDDDDGFSSDEDPDEVLVSDIVIPEPPEDDDDDFDDSESVIIPDKNEIMISEVVADTNKYKNIENNQATDTVLDGYIFDTNAVGGEDVELTNDLPPFLVDDCDSVCQPCENQIEVDNSTQTLPGENTDNENKNNTLNLQQQQKEKWKLWKTLEGNGILDTNELQCKMVANLLCLQCMMEKLSGIASLVQISDATLEIKVKKNICLYIICAMQAWPSLIHSGAITCTHLR